MRRDRGQDTRALVAARAQARALREALAGHGTTVSHAQALELLARQHGARDWNTLHARLAQPVSAPAEAEKSPASPSSFALRQRVRGRYLGQAFRGEIIALSRVGPGRTRVTVRFDEAVDVVRFESFSALRRQVTATLDGQGCSAATTSDGQPHMVLRAEDGA